MIPNQNPTRNSLDNKTRSTGFFNALTTDLAPGEQARLPKMEMDFEFDPIQERESLKKNRAAVNDLSNSVRVKNNRVSVMFDVNINKTNRLTMTDNSPWEIIDKDDKKLDVVSSLEIKRSNLKSSAFNARYKLTTTNKQNGKQGFFQKFMKVL